MNYSSPTVETLGGNDLMAVQGTWFFGVNHVAVANVGVVYQVGVAVLAAVVAGVWVV
jgi:hypothetical protein